MVQKECTVIFLLLLDIIPQSLYLLDVSQLIDDLVITGGDRVAKQIGYEMRHVKDSNIYVLWKTKNSASTPANESCVCSFWVKSLRKDLTRFNNNSMYTVIVEI